MRAFAVMLLLALPAAASAQQLDAEAYLSDCRAVPDLLRGTCATAQEIFVDDFAAGLKGDYWARVDVADCYRTSCDGAVEVDMVEACAWRLLIASAKHPRYDFGDERSLQEDCGALDASARHAAEHKAAEIAAQVQALN